ncbi:uncharacterized protein [Rutidosis leptorrhynchoides]|uniref:uncharacterized protein n=1 Tax=Rutidosis leptorrhynchoides TaxID=125765 RepID=UPI003A990E9C
MSSFGSSLTSTLLHSVSSFQVSHLSPIWKDLVRLQHDPASQSIVGSNVWKWKVGNGVKILLWHDVWVKDKPLKDCYPSVFAATRLTFITVSECFMLSLSNRLQFSEVELGLIRPLSLFISAQVTDLGLLMASIHLDTRVDDLVYWSCSSDGVYSVSDAIRVIVQSNFTNAPPWPKVVWGNNVPSKVMLFHWLAIRNSIPVYEILISRHILPASHSNLCIWCLEEVETVNHLLLHCKWAFKLWSDLLCWWNLVWVIPGSIEEFSLDWFFGMGIRAAKFWKLIGPATIWAIWLARNDFIFNRKFSCRSVLMYVIIEDDMESLNNISDT